MIIQELLESQPPLKNIFQTGSIINLIFKSKVKKVLQKLSQYLQKNQFPFLSKMHFNGFLTPDRNFKSNISNLVNELKKFKQNKAIFDKIQSLLKNYQQQLENDIKVLQEYQNLLKTHKIEKKCQELKKQLMKNIQNLQEQFTNCVKQIPSQTANVQKSDLDQSQNQKKDQTKIASSIRYDSSNISIQDMFNLKDLANKIHSQNKQQKKKNFLNVIGNFCCKKFMSTFNRLVQSNQISKQCLNNLQNKVIDKKQILDNKGLLSLINMMNFHIIYTSGALCVVELIDKTKNQWIISKFLGYSLKQTNSKATDINIFLQFMSTLPDHHHKQYCQNEKQEQECPMKKLNLIRFLQNQQIQQKRKSIASFLKQTYKKKEIQQKNSGKRKKNQQKRKSFASILKQTYKQKEKRRNICLPQQKQKKQINSAKTKKISKKSYQNKNSLKNIKDKQNKMNRSRQVSQIYNQQSKQNSKNYFFKEPRYSVFCDIRMNSQEI